MAIEAPMAIRNPTRFPWSLVPLQDEEVGCPRPISSQADADQQQGMRQGDGVRKGRAGYEKAVRQMMGGAPGTAAAAAAVHEGLFADRPAWMFDNPAGFSEDQTRQVSACWSCIHDTSMHLIAQDQTL